LSTAFSTACKKNIRQNLPDAFVNVSSAVAITVAALMALTVVVAAAAAAVVLAAPMVVIADGVGVKLQGSVEKCLYSLVSHTDDTGIEHHAGLCQCSAGAAADTAADEHISLQLLQKGRQSTVTAAVGRNDHRIDDLTAHHIIYLELLGVAKVLEDLAVFISNRDTHMEIPPF